MELSEHFNNVQMRQRTPCTITPDGRCIYFTEFGEMPEAEFLESYPLGIITKNTGKGENSDRTKAWMQDKKSY